MNHLTLSEHLTSSDRERFWANASLSDDGCWRWLAKIGRNGYGAFKANNRDLTAHRVAYFFTHGEIGFGMVIDHLCRTRDCVNPDHLEQVTQQENVRRGEHGVLGTHYNVCRSGHSMSGDNLQVNAAGRRECRECYREYHRNYRRKQRARLRSV